MTSHFQQHKHCTGKIQRRGCICTYVSLTTTSTVVRKNTVTRTCNQQLYPGAHLTYHTQFRVAGRDPPAILIRRERSRIHSIPITEENRRLFTEEHQSSKHHPFNVMLSEFA